MTRSASDAASAWAEGVRRGHIGYYSSVKPTIESLTTDYVHGRIHLAAFEQRVETILRDEAHRQSEPYGDDLATGEILHSDPGKSSRRP